MDQSSISLTSANQGNSVIGELDSLFGELQGLLGSKSDTNKLNSAMAAQAAINEAGDLENNVEYVSTQDGLKAELNTIQQREETRMSQVRQQNVLLSLRKEKLTGTDGYTRTLDNAAQVRSQKKNVPLGAPLEDESISEEQLYMHSLEDNEDVERSNKTSPDFGEAFLGSSHDAYTQKEEQRILDNYETDSAPEPEPVRKSLPLEKDEVLELDKLDQLFGDHLEQTLNSNDEIYVVSNSEIEGRILSLSDKVDRNKGSGLSLAREIEKRIERIGQFIDKAPDHQSKSRTGKGFSVPSSKSVERLRRKFGKI